MFLNFEPNERKTIPLGGKGFYVVSSSGPIEVELRRFDNRILEEVELLAGQGVQGVAFDEYSIVNIHDQAQEVQVYLGSSSFVDNRQVGVVSVEGVVTVNPIQEAQSPMYYGYLGSPGISGKYNICGIHNPAESGRDLYIAEFSVDLTKSILFRSLSSWQHIQTIGGFGSGIGSQLVDPDSVPGKGVFFWGSSSDRGFISGTAMKYFNSTSVEYRPQRYIKIPQGESMVLLADAAGAALLATWVIEERVK